MNTAQIKRALTLVLAAAALLTAGGCAVEESSMLVIGNSSLVSGSCQPDKSGQSTLSRGVMDLTISTQYLMFPVIQNQLGNSGDVKITPAMAGGGGGGGAAAGGGLNDTLIEGNTVILQKADVSFEFPPASIIGFPTDLTIPISGTISPGQVNASSLEIISPDLANILADQIRIENRGTRITVLVNLKFYGITASGTEIESTEFTYPLDICRDCLIQYDPLSLATTDDNKVTCNIEVKAASLPEDADTAEDPEIPCLAGQDVPVDCRVCRTYQSDPGAADAACDPL